MAVTAPVCNTTVFAPAPNPGGPAGFRPIPANATLEQAIKIINDNFSPKTQEKNFNDQLKRDIAKGVGSKTFQVNPSQVRKAAQDEISKISFIQTAIVRKKVKVENPEDRNQWVVDDRVKALIMTDKRTGARWVFEDANAGKGISAGNEETVTSG